MKIFNLLLLLICTASLGMAEVPDMELRGKGDARYLGFIKVYDAYLYTLHPEDTKDILAPDVSKCLKLDYAVSLTPEDFISSADTILKNQHEPETLLQVSEQITALNNAYQTVKKGEQYLLCYHAQTATTSLSLNNEEKVSIASAQFGGIYFGIWLGPKNPIDEDLRDDLLGRNK